MILMPLEAVESVSRSR